MSLPGIFSSVASQRPKSLPGLFSFGSSGLAGRLPRDVFHMDGLCVLRLDENRLTGPVQRLPPAIEVRTHTLGGVVRGSPSRP